MKKEYHRILQSNQIFVNMFYNVNLDGDLMMIKMFIFSCSLFLILIQNFCFAYTEKISLDGMNRLTNIYDYLNSNKYHFSVRINLGDIYLSQDESVIVTTGKGLNSLISIDVLAPGHATNKGIEVGMNWNDMIYAYGPAYPLEGFWQNHRNEENCGLYYPVKSEYYSGYDIVNYESIVSSLLQGEDADGIEFLINRKTKNNFNSLLFEYAQTH